MTGFNFIKTYNLGLVFSNECVTIRMRGGFYLDDSTSKITRSVVFAELPKNATRTILRITL